MGQLAGHHTWWILYTHHPQRVCIEVGGESGVKVECKGGGRGSIVVVAELSGAGTTCLESYQVALLLPLYIKSIMVILWWG